MTRQAPQKMTKHVPAGDVHHVAAGDHPARGCRVADHVEEGAPHVEVVVGMLVQRPGSHQVHGQADGRDDQHREALHRLRLKQPSPCLVENTEGDQEDRRPVDEGGEHLSAVQTEGAGIAGREPGQADRDKREHQGEKVEEDMSRIGKERQGVGPESSDNFGHQRQRGEGNGVFEAAGDAFVKVNFSVHSTSLSSADQEKTNQSKK